MSITMEQQDSLFSDPKVDEVVAALREVTYLVKTRNGVQEHKYPADPIADERFARALLAEYPTISLPNAVRAWQAWLYDNPLSGKVNLRSRLRTWIRNGLRFDAERRTRAAQHRPGDDRKGGGGPSTAPRNHASYGGTRRLGHDDW